MYDALIIGAGPAGSAAAYHASRHGLRVLLIDRVAFPRPKTCGDLLAPRALAAIERMGITDLPGHEIRGCWIIHEARKRRRYEDLSGHVAPHVGRVIGREQLDDILRTQACAAGAEWDVAKAERLLVQNGRVVGARLKTARGVVAVRARCVIAATGSTQVGQLIGTATRRARPVWGIAGRLYLTVEQELGNEIELYIPVTDQRQMLYGYAWAFPTGSRGLNVGVGLIRGARAKTGSLRSLLQTFLEERRARDPRFRGAAPCGSFASAPLAVTVLAQPQPGLLPIGDLAGLANPFTGEGITPALESGELAALACSAAGEHAATRYTTLVREQMKTQHELRPALPSLYSHPWQYFEHGLDLVMVPGHNVGDTIRQLVWDDPPPRPPQLATLPVFAAALVDRVRTAIVRIGRRPLLKQTLRGLVEQADAGFGWYAAFAAALHAGAHPRRALPARSFDVIVALETINLVSAVHRGIVPDLERRKSSWGRNTLSLLVADTLTARALKLMYGMEPSWCTWLGAITSQALRHQAATPLSPKRRRQRDTTDAADLFFAAALAGVATATPREASVLPPVVHRMATVLAAMQANHAEQTQLTALRRMLALEDSPWRGPLTSVLEALALPARDTSAGAAEVKSQASDVSDAGA